MQIIEQLSGAAENLLGGASHPIMGIAAQCVVERVQRTRQWNHVGVQERAVKRLLRGKDPSPPQVGPDRRLLISSRALRGELSAVGQVYDPVSSDRCRITSPLLAHPKPPRFGALLTTP